MTKSNAEETQLDTFYGVTQYCNTLLLKVTFPNTVVRHSTWHPLKSTLYLLTNLTFEVSKMHVWFIYH